MDIQKNTMNNNISFLRIRPCDNDNEIYLNSRKKEGTSTFLIKSDVQVNTDNLHSKEFQTVSKDITINADAWMVTDENWKEFKSVHPKRLIYIFKNNIEEILVKNVEYGIFNTKTESLFIKSKKEYISYINRLLITLKKRQQMLKSIDELPKLFRTRIDLDRKTYEQDLDL